MIKNIKIIKYNNWRLLIAVLSFSILAVLLIGRLVDMQLNHKNFLKRQGELRSIRTITSIPPRGTIRDRNGEILAISTKVHSAWINPKVFNVNIEAEKFKKLSLYTGVKEKDLKLKISNNKNKEFIYLKRHLIPETAAKIEALNVAGINFIEEYKRFYPDGPLISHVIGFTDIDDRGQEGIELLYDKQLQGQAGYRKIIRDRLGREIDNLEEKVAAKPGKDITLSIDRRLQYLSYKSLSTAISKHNAESGSIVVLDVNTGEVLAMVNQPSFNPNSSRKDIAYQDGYRNRAVTDYFEPASAIKPFSVVSFLENLEITPNTVINTGPGYMQLRGGVIRDLQNNGSLSLKKVLAKSSNIGISRLALSLPEGALWDTFNRLGLGSATTGSGFPGENSGILNQVSNSQAMELATQSFGYGVTVTPLQLARAYSILGSGGIRRDVSFLKQDDIVPGVSVVKEEIAFKVINMLKEAIDDSPSKAKVKGYHVAGKTGTARNLTDAGYDNKNHKAIFGGVVPAINPQFAIVVTINEPKNGVYYSNQVAAPIFSEISGHSLRLFNVAPDLLETQGIYIARNNK